MNLAVEFLLWFFIIGTIVFLFHDALMIYMLTWIFAKRSYKLVEIPDVEAIRVSDFNLPIITILLPLYKEKKILPYLIKSILGADYPKNKLDVRLLVESDDIDTIRAILSLPNRGNGVERIEYDRYRIPNSVNTLKGMNIEIDYIYSGPRNKPNALNVGLSRAKGSILVVYDAEDRPDPKQIRKAAVYMLEHNEIAAVQAALAYYNPDQSLITRFFTIEYIQNYFLNIPTQSSLNNVVLLGGTSNFFRTEVLRDLKGWDSKNVTEDADLGLRMAKVGYMVSPISTITWEESPHTIRAWMRQRLRWNKGFLYTLITHFLHPRQIFKQIGFKSAIFVFDALFYPIAAFFSLIGWIFFVVYWLDWLGIPLQPLAGLIHDTLDHSPALFYISLFTFSLGIIFSILTALEGLFRREDDYALRKVKFCLFAPIYQILNGIASIMAIIELIRNTQFWNKTEHGISIK